MRNPTIKGKPKLETLLYQEIGGVHAQMAALVSLLKTQSNTIDKITSAMTLLYDRIVVSEDAYSKLVHNNTVITYPTKNIYSN